MRRICLLILGLKGLTNKGGLKITVLFRFSVIVKLAKISLLAVLLYLTIYHKSSIVLPTPLSIKPPFVEKEIY